MGSVGHGDGHQGNIIHSDGKIFFFDNEYANEGIPVFIELAKPYYNDLIGSLIFHFEEILFDHFEMKFTDENETKISILAKVKKPLELRMALTKIKLAARRNVIRKAMNDEFRMNDYLILSHMLNKNPNLYSEKKKSFFLLFTCILDSFNSLDPESIYEYF
jgi:hypothetical protein